MTKHQTLGLFLKEARIRSGLSQKDVSIHLGYQTPQFVSNWERGLTTPPGRTLRELADLYQIPPEELYKVILEHLFKRTEDSFRKEYYGSSKRRG